MQQQWNLICYTTPVQWQFYGTVADGFARYKMDAKKKENPSSMTFFHTVTSCCLKKNSHEGKQLFTYISSVIILFLSTTAPTKNEQGTSVTAVRCKSKEGTLANKPK